LEVDPSSFLNGLAEVIGELRRYILDALRREEIGRCQELMDLMDEIYGVLVTVDFPEAVTGGLRRNTDAMRGVLERTRGDLTMALRQHRLESRLAQWEEGRAGGR
jgi:translin